jgi:hypothetical protein
MHVRFLGAATALCLLATASVAAAATLHFAAKLSGGQETPPNDSKGKGQVSATLDTESMTFSYKGDYSGLTGPATAAHFHVGGPGESGPPVVPLTSPASPVSGTATLTAAQVGDLKAGKWYFNVHTAAHPGGELRGQLKAAH